MSKVLDFIALHRPALEAQVEELRAQLEKALAELAEFDRVEWALSGNKSGHDVDVEEPSGNSMEDRMTIKEMVIDVLGVLPEGADAMTILTHINRRFNASIQRESLSPQLSRLKTDGRIRLSGRTWFLNEKGPAEAGPSLFQGAAGAGGGFPPDRPEGSIPSASIQSHTNGSALTGDRSAGAPPG